MEIIWSNSNNLIPNNNDRFDFLKLLNFSSFTEIFTKMIQEFYLSLIFSCLLLADQHWLNQLFCLSNFIMELLFKTNLFAGLFDPQHLGGKNVTEAIYFHFFVITIMVIQT